MVGIDELTWPGLIGWRFESVHTAMLDTVLQRVPEEQARRVEAILGFASGSVAESPFDDSWALEIAIGRSTGKRADLGGAIRLADGALHGVLPGVRSVDPSRTWVLIETKVHSAGSRDQLTVTAANSDHSVLLLLGGAAFDWLEADLIDESGYALQPIPGGGFEPGAPHGGPAFAPLPDSDRVGQMPAPVASGLPRRWRRLDPRTLHELLAGDEYVMARPLLKDYVDELGREADAHDRAWELTELGLPGSDEDERVAQLLARAYLGRVRVALRGDGSGLNVLTRRSAGETRLEFYPAGWSRGDHTEQTADLMLHLIVPASARGRPRLVLKAGAGHAAIEQWVAGSRAVRAIQSLTDEFEGSSAPAPGSKGDTRTLWTLKYEGDCEPRRVAGEMLRAAEIVNDALRREAA